ncbi:hypothetical protein MTO96_036658 [Rhipicephalus appendiculatus]
MYCGACSFTTKFRLPEHIILDCGSCFTSCGIKAFCQENGLAPTVNSAHNPRAKGHLVDRVKQSLVPCIMATIKDLAHKDWDQNIKEVESYLNIPYNASTGTSPFRLLHGYQPRMQGGVLRCINTENNKWVCAEQLQEMAQMNVVS